MPHDQTRNILNRSYPVLCTRLYLRNVVLPQIQWYHPSGLGKHLLTQEQLAMQCLWSHSWAQLFHVHVHAHSFFSFNTFGTEIVGCWGIPREPYWSACKSHHYSPNFLLIWSACVGSVHDFVDIQFIHLWASFFFGISPETEVTRSLRFVLDIKKRKKVCCTYL